jgi:Origin recognition complex subunit 2
VTTYEPYSVETAYCSRPLLIGSDESIVEGAVVLLSALSVNARNAFRLLAEQQGAGLGNSLQIDAPGGCQMDERIWKEQPAKQASTSAKLGRNATRTTFNDFFTQCRDRYLVSDPANLRTILTKLETNSLLDRRRAIDMAEHLWIPFSNSHLHVVLESLRD